MGQADQLHSDIAVRPAFAGEQGGGALPVAHEIILIRHHLAGVIARGLCLALPSTCSSRCLLAEL